MSTPAQRMVAEQLRPHGVTDERVLGAMVSVPREEFLAPRMRRHAYEDRALAIECGQTISQPLVVALMIQAASPQPEDGALEVGTGSGYAAAVLSRLCRKVVSVEREPALAEQASETLRRLGFDNVEVAVGDGSFGWPSDAPYNVILVAAAASGVPPAPCRRCPPLCWDSSPTAAGWSYPWRSQRRSPRTFASMCVAVRMSCTARSSRFSSCRSEAVRGSQTGEARRTGLATRLASR